MECTTCDGRGFITRQVPRKYKQHGVTVTLGNLTQSETVFCPTCEGSGRGVDPDHDPGCGQCQGTGWRGVMNCMDGSYDGTEPCLCERNEVPA